MDSTTTLEWATWAAQNAVNVFLQSTVLVLIGLLAAWFFRKHGSAVQSVIFRATLVAILICPILAILMAHSGFQGWTIKLPSAIQVVQVDVPVDSPVSADGSIVAKDHGSAKSNSVGQKEVLGIETNTDSFGEKSAPTAGVAFTSPTEPIPTSQLDAASSVDANAPVGEIEVVRQEVANELCIVLYFVLLGIWGLGVLFFLARLVVSYRSIYRLRKQSLLASRLEIKVCHQIAKELRVHPPEVYRNSLISSPCLTGITSPAILLPTEIESSIALEKAFTHELAHLRRRDNLWNLVQRLSLALFFFQPLLWWLIYRMETTAEEVCDDFVVRKSLDRAGYAQQLVELAESNLLAPNVAGLGMFSARSMLGHRVVRILDTTRKLTTQVSWPIVGTIVATALSATALCGLIGDRSSNESSLRSIGKINYVTNSGNPPQSNGSSVNKDAKLTASAEAKVKLESDSLLRFSGKIVDETGKPISGAKVIAIASRERFPRLSKGPYAVTKSAADGAFSVEFKRSQVLPFEQYEFDENIALVVTKPGYRINWAHRRTWAVFSTIPIHRAEESGRYLPVTIPLLKDTAPVSITLMDTEGTPVENANVRIKSITKLKENGAKAIVEASGEGVDYRTAVGKHMDGGITLHGYPTFKSNKNGQVTIPGIGENRIVALEISKKGMRLKSETKFLTHETKPISFNYGGMVADSIQFFGIQSTLICEPSQLIRGQVVDSETEKPLAGAFVQSSRFAGNAVSGEGFIRVTTDSNGRFELDGMPKGPGNVIAVIPGDHHPYFMMRYVVPEKEGLEPIDMTLKVKKGIWIRGKAVDAETGKPIVGAWLHYLPFLSNAFAQKSGVYGEDQFKEIQNRYLTDENGDFQLVGLPGKAVLGLQDVDGKYPVGIGWSAFDQNEKAKNGRYATTYDRPIKPGPKWPTAMKKIRIAEDETEHRVNFKIGKGMTTPIMVVGPDGNPLSGVTADRLESGRSYGSVLKTSTATAGGFMANETRLVRFIHHQKRLGCIVRLDSSTFADQKDALKIQLMPYAIVRGKLINQDDDPVPNATLTFHLDGGGDFSMNLQPVSSNKDGRFEHKEVLIGTHYSIGGTTENKMFMAGRNLKVTKSEQIDLGTINVDQEMRDPLPKPTRNPIRTNKD